MELEVEARRMEGLKLFFLTDNYMTYVVYYQVNASDKEIFELVMQLIYLYLRGCFRLHIMWVERTRQIATGIYGFSRCF